MTTTNYLKTAFLLALMSALIVICGNLLPRIARVPPKPLPSLTVK